MVASVELLGLLAANARGSVPPGALPAGLIRFTLEYLEPPDPAAERLRLVSMIGDGQYTLAPLTADGKLARFLVLQFAGSERSLSAKTLFALADSLVEPLGLTSCTPDLGTNVYAEPDAGALLPARREEVLLDRFCWSDAKAPTDRRWALAAINAPAAWALSEGAGIVIAQPDTGVAKHPELEAGALLLAKARNILDGSNDPTDPLDPSEANPGHGTATSSVAVSRKAGEMTGAAPAARLVPIRCVNDVKIVDSTPVAAAVDHAIRIGADVITMSLGGLSVPALNAAVEAAVEAGLIVVAAAGNCSGPLVVDPARNRRVVGVAGVDCQGKPWKGTAYGSRVTISAPAENVYVARRTPADGGVPVVNGGQGTSFATALTAGVAALWLGHHGRAAVKAEAKRRNIPVQELFRAALVATAQRPPGWIASRYGAGIVDAAALLQMPLADIPRPLVAEAAVVVSDVDEVLDRAELRLAEGGFDWARYGAMASYFAWDAARRADPVHAKTAESVPFQTPPTALTTEAAPPALRRALQARAAPAMRASPAVLSRSAQPGHAGFLERVGVAAGAAETAPGSGRVTPESARRTLQGGGADALVQNVQATFDEFDRDEGGRDAAASALRRQTLEALPEALGRVADGSREPLTPAHRLALEALVELTGRTAIRVRDEVADGEQRDSIDFTGAAAGPWGLTLLGMRDYIEQTLPKVGRIDVDDGHVGTGTVVGPGLILTNRHVAEAMADSVRLADGSQRWFLNARATINFDPAALDPARAFEIKEVIAAGPDPTFRSITFEHLDLALLAVETSNAGQRRLPGQVSAIGNAAIAEQRRDLFLIGYPAPPDPRSLIDPATNATDTLGVNALVAMFGSAYSVKYLSPGKVKTVAGRLSDDTRRWVFAHDATTLGGSSGSLAFVLGDPAGAFGLHFSGAFRTANYAHSLAAVKRTGVLPEMAELAWT